MKLNKILIIGGVMAASLSLGSCIGDLDLTPTNPTDMTQDKFENDPEAFMRQLMADIYLNISTFGANGDNILASMDGGMSTFQRSIFNLEEIPTDEACWLPAADAIPWTWQFGECTAADRVPLGAWSRMDINCSLCNQFLQTDFKIQNDRQQALHDEFARQARIIRSAMMYYMIDEFGNIPYNDETVLSGEIPPQLSTDFATGRRMATERVCNTLEEIVDWYKANDPANNPPYGYVGLDVAEALLVKFYLNYEVFTGTPAWDRCFAHAQAIIARRGNGGFNNTGLANNYFQNFSPNNTDQNEIIWRIVSQNADTHTDASGANVGILNWANGGLMLMGFCGADSQDYYNAGAQWACMVAREQLSRAFDWNDYACSTSDDDRVTWWQTSAQGYPIDNPDLLFANYGHNGYIPVKYINWYVYDDGAISSNIDGAFPKNSPVEVRQEALSPKQIDPPCIDYGMIRLAEIYLSAAEAALNGGGSTADALTYTNYIRTRAGLQPYTAINLTELQKERQRELYTECNRRTDLIRWNQWISGYNWNWKYHAKEGRDYPANFNVYPIPASVVTKGNYKQNPGY